MPTPIPVTNTLALVAFFAAVAAIFITWIIATHRRAEVSAMDQDARALAQRAILELCVAREEIAKLRGDTARDRDATRDEVIKQTRAIEQMGHKVNDALMETSKMNMAFNQFTQRRT